MALSDSKLRAVVNLLSDPLQAHVAAHILSREAKERGVLVADLVAQTLAPAPQAAPAFSSVDSFTQDQESIGKQINSEAYGLRSNIINETEKAWLVRRPEKGRWDEEANIWLPKSQVEHRGEDSSGRAILIVPMWLARRKGLA
jgi:hypothetical protein